MDKKYDLTGLGYCGLDYLSLIPRIPIDDKVQAIQTLTQGGGPSATATFAAARLGARTAFIGSVGNDERGNTIIAGLRDAGIDTSAMAVRDAVESPAAFCWTEQDSGNRSIVWTRGSASPLTPEELKEEMIASSRLLHLDGHQTAAAIHAAAIARKHHVCVSIDAGTMVPGIERLLGLCDLIVASEKFAATYTGETQPEKSLPKLFADSCRFAAVTMGSKGSFGFDGKNFFHQPAFKVKVIDTTGAGDVFHGAFAFAWLQNQTWPESLRFAAAVAALKCTGFGGRSNIPDLNTTMNFLKENTTK